LIDADGRLDAAEEDVLDVPLAHDRVVDGIVSDGRERVLAPHGRLRRKVHEFRGGVAEFLGDLLGERHRHANAGGRRDGEFAASSHLESVSHCSDELGLHVDAQEQCAVGIGGGEGHERRGEM
jgi:hypothetical protein